MTGSTDIQEFEESNYEALVEDFVTAHQTEYNDYFRNSIEDGMPMDYYADDEGYMVPEDDDLKSEFCTEHPYWERFIEIEYATRGQEE